mmetsp:Transcript_24999/g.52910  ORF Transcript_24999/g.52910 Transcript_24999/m.52910 type:complete len:459 (+) Transcript_24999:110-1486(+)
MQMRQIERRSQSPIMWRAGESTEASSADKISMSYDSPSSLSCYEGEGDDDTDGGEEEIAAYSALPERKVKKFDTLLRRIEAERQKITADAEVRPPPRQSSRARSGRGDTPGSSGNYDFASRARELRKSLDVGGAQARSLTPKRPGREDRARELRMSLDGASARTRTPKRPERESKSKTPPRKSRMSYDGIPAHKSMHKRSEHDFSQRPTSVTPPRRTTSVTPSRRPTSVTPPRRSAGNTPTRSSSRMRVPSPNSSQPDFKGQVEKFHSSLVLAHDTIATLEKDVRSLKKTISSLEHKNMMLEQKNESLNQTLTKHRDEVKKIKEENRNIIAEKKKIPESYTEELDRLQSECDGYKKYVKQIDKLSAERDSTVKEIVRAKHMLEESVQDRDQTINSLRDEIHCLNQELAEGSLVKAKAQKAEEAVKKLEAELLKTKKADNGTKVTVDLNQSNITITRSS